LLVAANIATYAVGLSGTVDVSEAAASDRINQTLGLLGITTTRISFPLTFGVNGFGAIAAVSMLICSFQATYTKGWIRASALVLLPCTLAALAMTDSRGAMAYALLAGTFAYLTLKRPPLIKLTFIGIALTPILPSLGYRLFHAANHGQMFSFMTRPGSQGAKLGFGTGRGDIWEAVLSHLTNPSFQHLIGYGAYGQTTSGVSKQYAWVFNELGSSHASCHNTFLQYIMDGGYIGGAMWMAILIAFAFQARRLVESPSASSGVKAIVTALLSLTLLQSQTEAFGAIYTPEILILIITMVALCGFLSTTGPVAHTEQPVQWRRRRLFA